MVMIMVWCYDGVMDFYNSDDFRKLSKGEVNPDHGFHFCSLLLKSLFK